MPGITVADFWLQLQHSCGKKEVLRFTAVLVGTRNKNQCHPPKSSGLPAVWVNYNEVATTWTIPEMAQTISGWIITPMSLSQINGFSPTGHRLRLHDVVKVVATRHTYGAAFAALRSTGSVVTWGHSLYGGDSSLVQHRLRTGGGHQFVSFFSDKIWENKFFLDLSWILLSQQIPFGPSGAWIAAQQVSLISYGFLELASQLRHMKHMSD